MLLARGFANLRDEIRVVVRSDFDATFDSFQRKLERKGLRGEGLPQQIAHRDIEHGALVKDVIGRYENGDWYVPPLEDRVRHGVEVVVPVVHRYGDCSPGERAFMKTTQSFAQRHNGVLLGSEQAESGFQVGCG